MEKVEEFYPQQGDRICFDETKKQIFVLRGNDLINFTKQTEIEMSDLFHGKSINKILDIIAKSFKSQITFIVDQNPIVKGVESFLFVV